MPNAGKYFLQGFDSAYDRSASAYEENLRQKQSEEYQTQKETQKEQAKLKAQQDAQQLSEKNITAYQNATPEDKAKALIGLTKDDLTKIEKAQNLTKKQEDQTKQTKSSALLQRLIGGEKLKPEDYTDITNADYTKYKDYRENQPEVDYSRMDGIYLKDRKTGELTKIKDGNPRYVPKHVGSTTGYNENGNKVEVIIFDTGKTIKVDTGLNKKNEISDETAFEKNMSDINKETNELFKEKESLSKMSGTSTYSNLTDDKKQEAVGIAIDGINAKARNLQEKVVLSMPKEALAKLDEFYTYAKKNKLNADDPTTYEGWIAKEKQTYNPLKDAHTIGLLERYAFGKYGYMDKPGQQTAQEKKDATKLGKDPMPGQQDSRDPIVKHLMEQKGYTEQEAKDIIKQHGK